MEALLKQLGPLAAVIATALINITNSFVAKIVPDEIKADVLTLVQVGVMAIIIYASNQAVKVVGNRIESKVESKTDNNEGSTQ